MGPTKLKNGELLTIRKVREDDAEQLIGYLNTVGGESDFLTFGKDGCRFTVEEEKSYLRGLAANPENLFLVGFLNGELACSANLVGSGNQRISHNCELGITVRKKYWNLGAASALLTELFRLIQSETAFQTVHLGVYENNERAIRLYEKFGFKTVGRHKNYFHVGDRYYGEILMDLDMNVLHTVIK